MVQVAPGVDPDVISSRIRQPSTAITVIKRHFTLDPASQDVSGIPSLLNMISAVVIVATLPLIAIISAMVSFERQREIGLFMSMGAKKNVIFSLVIAESLILAALGGVNRCRCKPGGSLPAECAGISYQCSSGIIPYAIGNRDKYDNSDFIICRDSDRKYCITLACLSQQHDEPVRCNTGRRAVKACFSPQNRLNLFNPPGICTEQESFHLSRLIQPGRPGVITMSGCSA